MSTAAARRGHTVLDMDPVRNPYAPGAGQRPPELAGRDTELSAFDVVLERIAHGRPERSLVLTGLRGVGKTVLLNQLRSAAIGRGWGTGKIEARPEQSLRRPVSSALHMALRELRHPDQDSMDAVLGVLKAFALRESADGKVRDRWQPGIDVPPASGRADSGDMEIDLVELLSDAAGLAADVGKGIALFIDEMQDVQPDDVSAICAACHELSQQGAPLIVVGAGLPHLPAVLSASKSYSERLFRYLRIDRLDREAADRALLAPAEREDVAFDTEALDALYAAADGYPYFVQAYGKVTWDVAAASPITAADVAMAAPVAEAELAVGFFGSRYDRATPAEREYMHAMAELGGPAGAAVATSEVAVSLGRKPASLSPARDSLIKKGLVYSAERGSIAFTVPHFGRYLLSHPD
jgi:AAA ATPase domain